MVLIPAGEFVMGSSESGPYSQIDERHRHSVFLNAFYLDKYEVSVGQFRKFVEETEYKALGYWKDPSFDQSDKHPVVLVSWYDAIRYCNWRSIKEGLEPCYSIDTSECNFAKDGYRLPTRGRMGEGSAGERWAKFSLGKRAT